MCGRVNHNQSWPFFSAITWKSTYWLRNSKKTISTRRMHWQPNLSLYELCTCATTLPIARVSQPTPSLTINTSVLSQRRNRLCYFFKSCFPPNFPFFVFFFHHNLLVIPSRAHTDGAIRSQPSTNGSLVVRQWLLVGGGTECCGGNYRRRRNIRRGLSKHSTAVEHCTILCIT